ncbi:hypothetical protein BJY52DRAFT_596180 [Lactarius psammicola]|nr:hypothetical protein BJY52DRAFT_596180 [Lactarius psammicola]
MNHPHTATTDPYAFSLWPDAAASSEEETRLWAQTAGYAQTGFTSDKFSFDGLDATAAWGQSATLPAAAYGLENISGSDWTSGGIVPAGDMLGHGVSLMGAATTDAMAFAQAPAPPFSAGGIDAFTRDFFITQSQEFSNSLSSTPPLTDGSSVPSPQSEGTGMELFHSLPLGGRPPTSSNHRALRHRNSTSPGRYSPINSLGASPSWFMGDGNLAGQLPLGYLPTLDPMNMNGTMSYPMELGYNQTHDHITAPAEALTMMVTGEMVASSSLGKRIRKYETYSYCLP